MPETTETVRNWKGSKSETLSSGVTEYLLLDTEKSVADRLRVRVLTIDIGAEFEPEHFEGEVFYHVLAGNGLLHGVTADDSEPVLLEANTGGWFPGTRTHRFENTGEAPLRCLAVSCGTDGNYESTDGEILKLGSVTTESRYNDVWKGYDVEGCKRLALAGYQALASDDELGEHSHDEEISYLIRGEGKLTIDGSEHELTAGTAMHVPAEVPHNLISTGTDQFGYLVIEVA